MCRTIWFACQELRYLSLLYILTSRLFKTSTFTEQCELPNILAHIGISSRVWIFGSTTGWTGYVLFGSRHCQCLVEILFQILRRKIKNGRLVATADLVESSFFFSINIWLWRRKSGSGPSILLQNRSMGCLHCNKMYEHIQAQCPKN